MKKKLFFTILLVLALLTLTAGAASAESYVTLGSFTAGEELDVDIGWVDIAAQIIAEDVPPGLRVEREESDGDCLLSLKGTPMYAGDERFTIDAGELFVCTLQITPAVPRVSVPQDQVCSPGDTVELKATASADDAGTLRYQWYSAAGPINDEIPGATGNILRPDTSEPGTVWYCCEVTNSNNGFETSVMSDYVGVQVRQLEVRAVSIESLPRKTDYLLGEALDTTGLRILIKYENGYNEIRDEGFELTPAVLDTPGTQNVTVSFAGYNCGFDVTVRAPEESVTGIGVLTLPYKTEYVVGDLLETDGLSIRARTVDGTSFDMSEELDCSPVLLDREGQQTVTVRYAGKTCTFTVTVKQDKVVTGISVLTLPTTLTYTVGDRLDTTGLALKVNTNKGAEPLTDGYTYTPKVLTTPGTQEITVIYGQYQTKFNVTVKAREAVTPTPKPTAPPAEEPGTSPDPGASPDVSVTPHPVETPPMRKNTGVNTAVKIIFAIAVLALAGLAGYVWYLRKQGYDEEESGDDEPTETVSGEPMDDDRKE
ncbi:MAG: bacterial Ig-like domain-containing protein [Oscillospiraceae bacterium]|nr:bacterial Ig-like domain-containing protein [Oscillospiraceae bacterium]